MDTLHIVSKAQIYAYKMHEGMSLMTIGGKFKRPQLLHIQEVADLVWASGGSDEEVAAAWLHDTVEDTAATHEHIDAEFGKEIAEIVFGLTDLDEITDLPMAERKAKQAERIQGESVSVRRIKLADQASNMRFLALDPPEGWSLQDCRDYVAGARKIANECKGISPLLEKLFDEMYERAHAHYNS